MPVVGLTVPLLGRCAPPGTYLAPPGAHQWLVQQFERCSNSRVRPVVGQALSDRSTCRRVGQACPISSWDRSDRTSRDRSDKSVQPVGSRFGRTVPVRPPVEHGCSSTARTAVFDRLMPAVEIPW
ncbi:hypothetical protein PCANC_06359 [Puccinia coronata f. sp. avenae]|uniref:Uncharacterized protein n=1 Tax=Puccinia coronata f. sp. avenae TaxID=200324 RepID=A0A2N5T1T8_9BASI|nr:hypothetical protein PCANC_06359 [Puccinia coronata f. sp. avenae]